MQLSFIDQEDPQVESTMTIKIEDLITGEVIVISRAFDLGEQVQKGKKVASHVTRRSTRRCIQDVAKNMAKSLATQLSGNKPEDGWETVL